MLVAMVSSVSTNSGNHHEGGWDQEILHAISSNHPRHV